jgi:hypothetical protein
MNRHLRLFSFILLFLCLGNSFAMQAQSNQKTEELKASIYPSEIRENHFFIELSESIELSDANLKIVNLLGSEVPFNLFKQIDGRYKVELHNIPTGIYIVRVTKDRKQSTQRIVVRNS